MAIERRIGIPLICNIQFLASFSSWIASISTRDAVTHPVGISLRYPIQQI
jgi:hypothetical protein